MSTKLSRFCDGIMEAVWLAALITVPVFFNIYSSRIFEPDKLALLRSLALIGLGAWLVKLFEQGGTLWEMTREPGERWYQTLLKIPLLRQIGVLIGVFVVATVFSISPRASFWGSYQRLQGAYTTFGYLVIFAMVAMNMRRREQVNRLILTVILASLPIGLYGILQKFQIDPVPWGGDVSRRIAANMGNSIFVAAYLILAFPLTLGKIVESFTAILEEEQRVAANVARGTIFVFTAAIQLIAIYLSGSRGPFLGLLAGVFVMILLLSLYWNKRWLTWTIMGSAGAVLAFLVVFSIPNGPLASLQSKTGLGRLSKVFEVESGTGRVRVLIWEGAAKLVGMHKAIEFPDGKTDTFNFMRPLIGYGPESMYVAYNNFYPPELANIESRNASPDRSHNETWDALVTTGILGLIAYLTVFTSIFYYGLHWLGMITSARQRNLFLGLVLGGGTASAIGFVVWGGIGFFGVGFPYGMLTGLGLYVALVSLFSRYTPPQTEGEKLRALTLMMFLAAIIAHFGEIHLGIAIAATRTHFWAYTAVMIAVGYVMPRKGVYGNIALPEEGETVITQTAESSEAKGTSKKQKRTNTRQSSRVVTLRWQRIAVVSGIITSIVLSTLGYDYITNSKRVISAADILWTSLTTLPNKEYQVSYGILALIITLWLAAGVLFTAENKAVTRENWLAAFGLTLGVSGGLALLFWFIHAGGLANVVRTAALIQQQNNNTVTLESITAQVTKLEGLLTTYYLYLTILILLLAWAVIPQFPREVSQRGFLGLGIFAVMAIVVASFVSYSNLRIVHADIAYKLADPFARGEDPIQWEYAIELYQRANRYAPSEDYYYLFLGRAYLERARLLQASDPAETQRMMTQAKDDLLLAQRLNPLNTDHTANLARLHRFWAQITTDQVLRTSLAQQASDYYARAVVLSPNNVVIWDEWAVLNLSLLQSPARAVELLKHSLEIDPEYFGTYGTLAQYYAQQARQETDATAKQTAYENAIKTYGEAISHVKKNRDATNKYNYLLELADLQSTFADYEQAIASYNEALTLAGKNQGWRIQVAIAKIYLQLGQKAQALDTANAALANTPDNQKSQVQDLITLIQQQP
ncbi:MAG: O-antigen ligase family protein [Anaerolineales bacterium]|nr:O-antigen ligase family protein [Anaerolineales bacterium]